MKHGVHQHCLITRWCIVTLANTICIFHCNCNIMSALDHVSWLFELWFKAKFYQGLTYRPIQPMRHWWSMYVIKMDAMRRRTLKTPQRYLTNSIVEWYWHVLTDIGFLLDNAGELSTAMKTARGHTGILTTAMVGYTILHLLLLSQRNWRNCVCIWQLSHGWIQKLQKTCMWYFCSCFVSAVLARMIYYDMMTKNLCKSWVFVYLDTV